MDFAQEVKRANDIVDVIGSYLELRRSGTTFFARCPFHGEKTGSFAVNRDMQIFHCFGCGESGDVIKFVQKYESCSWYEALEMLAKRANLKMPENARTRRDYDYEARKKQRDLHLEICRETAIFYYKAFRSDKGSKARAYMESRGFDAATLKKFGIGYSPNGKDLLSYLLPKFSRQSLIDCGVVKTTQDGNAYDALSGRLIVPIFNMQGKVIAFGGRGLEKRTIERGKYKNTADTLLFRKTDNLFAINLVKEEKQQGPLPNVVIVEGYMDVIAMYQAGFKRAVASMGTSLTQNQAKLLSRLTDVVYVCYDGDAAGQKATVRGMDILDAAGLEVKVMSVPENLDPDEYIKKYGAQAFEGLISEALSLPDYKLKLLDEAFPINSADAAKRNDALPKYVNGALKMLKQLDDVRQTQYISAVSLKTGYSQEYLRRKLAGTSVEAEPRRDSTEQQGSAPVADSPELKAKFFVAACLLHGESYAALDQKPLCNTPFLSKLYDYLLDCTSKNVKPQADMMYTVCADGTRQEFDAVLSVDLSPNKKDVNRQYFNECKRLLQVEKLKAERTSLLAEIKANPSRSEELLPRLAEINSQING